MGTFQDVFRGCLKARGWKQKEAAAALGISQGQVSAYLNGTGEPATSTLVRMSARLGISLDELAGQPAGPVPSTLHTRLATASCARCAELERECRALQAKLAAIEKALGKKP